MKFLFLLLLVFVAVNSEAQQQSSNKLHRVNPEGWFTLLVPNWAKNVQPHADVDGGSYNSKNFDISWDYWTYNGTPNFMRDSGGRYRKSPVLACPNRNSARVAVDGFKGFLQKCKTNVRGRGLRYVSYITFPHIMVREIDRFH